MLICNPVPYIFNNDFFFTFNVKFSAKGVRTIFRETNNEIDVINLK